MKTSPNLKIYLKIVPSIIIEKSHSGPSWFRKDTNIFLRKYGYSEFFLNLFNIVHLLIGLLHSLLNVRTRSNKCTHSNIKINNHHLFMTAKSILKVKKKENNWVHICLRDKNEKNRFYNWQILNHSSSDLLMLTTCIPFIYI